MARHVTRRDFINGVALATGAGMLGTSPLQALEYTGTSQVASFDLADYPPVRTGLRGSHEGSFEVAHALAWRGEKPSDYEALDEHYDLAVVGAGMSGLAAAWYYREKMGPNARILLLDNHDDFGGHAKRNEFHHRGRMVLSLGGAQNLDSPSNYSEAAASLMRALGIDQNAIDAMDANTPEDYLLGGKWHGNVGLSLPRPDGHVTVGGHWYKYYHGRGNYTDAVRALPILEEEQDRLIAFLGGERDFLGDLSLAEQYEYVRTTSYNRFLMDRVGLSRDTTEIFDAHLLILQGHSGWQHTVLEAIAAGAPGLRAMGWLTNFIDSLAALLIEDLAEVRMFPDGNASVARLLVQELVPNVAPGMTGIEDVATAHFRYDQLDLAGQSTRIRLNSTVVGVRETEGRVLVEYVRAGAAECVTAGHCVLACYNNLIPHLCPEMSEKQKEGLRYGVRAPFVYANVLLDNGRAFSQLGVQFTHCPRDPFQWVSAAPTMTTGGYSPPRDASDPMAVFMMASPTPAAEHGVGRELYRAGRHRIYAATFEQYEEEIRQQLQSMLGEYGFDHARDIRAITVNRIPHGYAYSYLGLDDPEWAAGEALHEIGRARFGRISIANTDAEAMPLMDAAFDAAWRAIEEQTSS